MTTIDISRFQKVFAFLFCSLDGYHEDENGELAWNHSFIDDEFFEWNLRQNRSVGTLVLGRRTYEHFAAFWPSDAARDHAPETAAFMNEVPKLVVSRSTGLPGWPGAVTVDGSDLRADLERLRADADGDVAVFGSSGLTVSLLDQGLVDELRILVHPVLLGRGRSVFAGLGERVPLSMVSATTFRSGNVLLTYRP